MRSLKEIYDEEMNRFELNYGSLLVDKRLLMMRDYKHHKQTTSYEHVIRVARYSHLLARLLRWEERSIVRGALLHDYYLYHRLRCEYD